MNVLFISRCDNNALKETRRILDQFGERKGSRSWQTPITQIGLATVHKLLRKTARRNTSVACHWLHGGGQCDLLWIVGDASRFNNEGAIPTNSTTRNILRQQDENDWITAEDIQILAQMAALLHDLGKASKAFQRRLRSRENSRNLYRHEWVSLRLFQAFVGDDTDEVWLTRLLEGKYSIKDWVSDEKYKRDGLDKLDKKDRRPFQSLPPMARAIGWLIVSHHRLPLIPVDIDKKGHKEQGYLGKKPSRLYLETLEDPLSEIEHSWNERAVKDDDLKMVEEKKNTKSYWDIERKKTFPVFDKEWQKKAAKLAQRLLVLQKKRDIEKDWLGNPYLMHLARLSLMLADHHYSSLPPESLERLSHSSRGIAKEDRTILYANTDSQSRLKQTLDEHLLGVTREAGIIAYALPNFTEYLPRLAKHKGLKKRSSIARFAWQDKAVDMATAIRKKSEKQGAFCVCMASTGTGKTLASARIINAMADPEQGMRLTYALGLRALTLQTGKSYQKDLHLNEDDLAIMVGGRASKSLFEYYSDKAEKSGSASSLDLLEEDSYISYDGCEATHPLLSRLGHDPKIRSLLSAPVLVCTVDHLVPATESLRGGRQIAPMLRLMGSDLVLDELDDYDLKDLPALTRLVYWAGMLGSRVLLSSATLPPSLVLGMYQAYLAGRKCYQFNHDPSLSLAAQDVPCLWIDEFGTSSADCVDAAQFEQAHDHFIKQRKQKLLKKEAICKGEIVPLDELYQGQEKKDLYKDLAGILRQTSLELHGRFADKDPVTGRKVSFGLIRMANIEPLFHVAQAFFALGGRPDTHIHLCVYHARFPLIQRSAIENMLDTVLNRRDPDFVYTHSDIRTALDTNPEQDHVFIILASPVCEVGRDWDLDWAIAEPSSMRALIQLAGRVQRHRRKAVEKPNIAILNTALRYFENPEKAVFRHPGFEMPKSKYGDNAYHLKTHWINDILRLEEYQIITALPRIAPLPEEERKTQDRLADLEQARICDCMLPRKDLGKSIGIGRTAKKIEPNEEMAALCWQYPQASLTGILPQWQPFRENTMEEETLLFLFDEEEEKLKLYLERKNSENHNNLYMPVDSEKKHQIELHYASDITAWNVKSLESLLEEQSENLGISLLECSKYMTKVNVLKELSGYYFNNILGFSKYKN
ncbi:type I-F CRISPR-associated helicase Cas3f [Zymomonas sp.]|uniref:type I-F CRISPR-associated helicase Cas3f n=1 Tax=Zymomonas sp. TaxID=2068624 RepID=UPI0025F8CA5F|nr:type I-F CRISPR-associated helicase Cas3f [Zymomonas sp.]MCA1955169.1 type I-F CRISPR-associated helicase Cas3f [Zymomonas sp.]